MKWLCVFLTYYFVSKTEATCPPGTIQSITDTAVCYLFNSTKQAYLNAEESCVENNGHLVSIKNMFENVFVREQSQQHFTDSTESDFWIGLTDLMIPGSWRWIDGSTTTFTDWEKGQPQNGPGYDCGAAKLQGGMWISDDCDKPKPFVCKIVSTVTIMPITVTVPSITAETTTTIQSKKCPDSWIFYEKTKSCYKILHNKSWQDSEEACYSEGAHLASIHSLDENNFVTNLIPFNANDHICDYKNIAWIGLYTVDRQDTWQWTDDSSYNFSTWASNRNSNTKDDFCAYIWNGPVCSSYFGSWGDGYCPYKGFAVCKKSI